MSSFAYFIWGTVCGLVIALSVIDHGNYYKDAQKIITQCESELPRNVKCKLIAVEEK